MTVSDGTSEVDNGDLLGGDVSSSVAQLPTHVAKSLPQLVQVLLQGVLLYFQRLLLLLNTLCHKYSLFISSMSAKVTVNKTVLVRIFYLQNNLYDSTFSGKGGQCWKRECFDNKALDLVTKKVLLNFKSF